MIHSIDYRFKKKRQIGRYKVSKDMIANSNGLQKAISLTLNKCDWLELYPKAITP